MDNKEYKKIAKKEWQRFKKLQELELKGPKIVFNFISEYIYKNNLNDFFDVKLFNNYETKIYLRRGKEKILVLRVGNKITKNKLTKKLVNLNNYLNEKEKSKYKFIDFLQKNNIKIKDVISDSNEKNWFISSKDWENENYIIIHCPRFENEKIYFGIYETTKVELNKYIDFSEKILCNKKITLNLNKRLSPQDFLEFIHHTLEMI